MIMMIRMMIMIMMIRMMLLMMMMVLMMIPQQGKQSICNSYLIYTLLICLMCHVSMIVVLFTCIVYCSTSSSE
jgi:hypothetical protein